MRASVSAAVARGFSSQVSRMCEPSSEMPSLLAKANAARAEQEGTIMGNQASAPLGPCDMTVTTVPSKPIEGIT